MRVLVDLNLCQGHGQCEEAAPDVFEVGEDDAVVHLRVDRPAEEHRPQVEEAVWRCPTEALGIVED